MPVSNVKQLLVQGAAYPAMIEARLPEGAPSISSMLLDTAGKMPITPDFPVEIPDLPTVPEVPEMPVLGGSTVTVRPVEGVPTRPLGKEILS